MENRAKGENEAADAEEIKHFARRLNGGRGGGGRVGGGGERGIIFVSSAVVFREDNAPWEPQSWVQPTQKTRPGITVQRWLAFRPPVCLRASATSRFSPGRGEKGPKRCETKVSGKMVPLRENEGRRSEIAERLVIASA